MWAPVAEPVSPEYFRVKVSDLAPGVALKVPVPSVRIEGTCWNPVSLPTNRLSSVSARAMPTLPIARHAKMLTLLNRRRLIIVCSIGSNLYTGPASLDPASFTCRTRPYCAGIYSRERFSPHATFHSFVPAGSHDADLGVWPNRQEEVHDAQRPEPADGFLGDHQRQRHLDGLPRSFGERPQDFRRRRRAPEGRNQLARGRRPGDVPAHRRRARPERSGVARGRIHAVHRA